MRGDRPIVVAQRDVTLLFTPHARGSTLTPPFCLVIDLVYPACAGIDRLYPLLIFQEGVYPHARIDLSPPAFLSCHRFTSRMRDRPTLVQRLLGPAKFTRMRDRPRLCITTGQKPGFTPHARGSTLNKCSAMSEIQVYPACAGIDRR